MTDTFTTQQRSVVMARVKNRNTKPEIVVRSLLHCMGYRFRLHRKDLPGHPDICLPGRKKAIFVHGCFWHGHQGCRRATRPTSNVDFWNTKIDRNIARDRQVLESISVQKWQALTVWECETKNPQTLESLLQAFLCEE